jgi:hypothetical protein
MTRLRVLRLLGLTLLLGGCNLFQERTEFAPPQSRWPSTLPAATSLNAPPPSHNGEYCYRTLAAVDCFSEAKPDRVTGYTGLYPEPSPTPVH